MMYNIIKNLDFEDSINIGVFNIYRYSEYNGGIVVVEHERNEFLQILINEEKKSLIYEVLDPEMFEEYGEEFEELDISSLLVEMPYIYDEIFQILFYCLSGNSKTFLMVNEQKYTHKLNEINIFKYPYLGENGYNQIKIESKNKDALYKVFEVLQQAHEITSIKFI